MESKLKEIYIKEFAVAVWICIIRKKVYKNLFVELYIYTYVYLFSGSLKPFQIRMRMWIK